MKPHVVKQGECLESLAARYGSTASDLHGHDRNRSLRDARPDPSVLAPGDIVWVPSDPPRRHAISSGGTFRFKGRGATTPITIAVQDGAGHPIEDKPYRLAVGRATYEGTTTSEGLVEARIPTLATLGDLTVWPSGTAGEGREMHWTLRFGGLDPASTPDGVQGRLENLGYRAEGDLENAIRSFQASRGLEPTGEADEATLRALTDAVGG
jgi:hypothetical protein